MIEQKLTQTCSPSDCLGRGRRATDGARDACRYCEGDENTYCCGQYNKTTAWRLGKYKAMELTTHAKSS